MYWELLKFHLPISVATLLINVGNGHFYYVYNYLLYCNIFSYPVYVMPGTFYGIEKYCPVVENKAFKVGMCFAIFSRKGTQTGLNCHFLKYSFK